MTYRQNKLAAIYNSDMPTETDQASAKETDINVIVGKMLRTGQVNTTSRQSMYADFSELPPDYRAMIEQVRNVERLRHDLPDKLRNMSLDEIAYLTPEQAKAILTPPAATPAATPAPTEEKPK